MSNPDADTDRLERSPVFCTATGRRIMLVELPTLVELLDMRRDSSLWHRVAGKGGYHMDAAPALGELRNLPAARKHNVIKMGGEIKVYRHGLCTHGRIIAALPRSKGTDQLTLRSSLARSPIFFSTTPMPTRGLVSVAVATSNTSGPMTASVLRSFSSRLVSSAVPRSHSA